MEIELPWPFSLLGVVSTPDSDSGGGATPYGAGIQWRYGSINISASVLSNGAFDEPRFFWGIGPNIEF